MKPVLKLLIASLALAPFNPIIAGTMGGAVAMPSPAGFSGSLGLALDTIYSQINVGTYASLIGEASSIIEIDSGLNGKASDTTTGFTPLIQLSYWQERNNNWFFGPRFVYQYIGQNNHSIMDNVYDNSSTNGANSITNPLLEVLPNVTLNAKHEFSLLAMAGRQMSNFFVYGGVGPTYFLAEYRGSARANGNYTNNTQGYPKHSNVWEFTSSVDTWGGVATLGTSYFLTNNFSVDISAYFAFAPSKTASYTTQTVFYQSANNNASPVSAQATGVFNGSYLNQSVALTLTRYFA